jgi:hypothetical protein
VVKSTQEMNNIFTEDNIILKKNTYKYSADCIRCDNERMKAWRVNHKEQKKQSDLKYVKSERGYF